MKNNPRWILLITSLCLIAVFIIIGILYQPETRTDIVIAKQVTNEPGKTPEGSRKPRHNIIQPGIRNDEVWDIPDNDNKAGALKQDVLERKSNLTKDNHIISRKSEEDDEFKRWYHQMYQEEVERYKNKIEENIARIDPLFEEIEFYKAQVEPFKRQENWEASSKAWAKYRSLEGELLGIYIFLRDEELKKVLGHLYLPTPQYARVNAFAENWYATTPRNYNIPHK